MPFDPDQYLAQKKAFDPDQYLSEKSGDSGFVPPVNEMHPELTIEDRFLVKNFGNDIDSSIEFLRKRHPNLDVKKFDNEIVAKAPGEKEYRKLDPGGFLNSISNPTELAQDIGDVGYDIGAGIGQTAATAAGGLAGNLPGAAAAGAGSGAGLEALRQGLGQYFGVNKDISMGDVATSGVIGAASPLLLGSGASAAQAAKTATGSGLTGAARSALGMGGDTAEQILAANKGGISRLLPKVGAFTSGISSELLKEAPGKMPLVDSLDETGIKNFSRSAMKRTAQATTSYKREIGAQIGDQVKNIAGQVDLAEAKNPILNLRDELAQELKETGSEASQEALDELDGLLNKYFMRGEKVVEGEGEDAVESTVKSEIKALSPKSSLSLAQRLEDFADARKLNESGYSRHGAGTSVADKRIMNVAKDAATSIRTQLDDLSGGELAELNGKYSDALNLEKELKTYLKDPRATYRNLSNVLAPGNRTIYETMADVDKQFPEAKLIDSAKTLALYKKFSKAPWLAMSADGTTSTSRTVPMATAGSSLGYWGGANSGMGQGMAAIGAAIGSLTGSTVGSPAALRKYMATARNAQFMEDQMRRLSGGQPVTKAAIQSAWNAMNHGGE
jgi:hypothetical protein